jgi:hypothetical protein
VEGLEMEMEMGGKTMIVWSGWDLLTLEMMGGKQKGGGV